MIAPTSQRPVPLSANGTCKTPSEDKLGIDGNQGQRMGAEEPTFVDGEGWRGNLGWGIDSGEGGRIGEWEEVSNLL